MYIIKTPKFIRSVFPNFIWKMPTDQKEVFFTFDDGPIPEVTHGVLDTLAEYDAKASFFCVGQNVAKYPEIFQAIQDQGHSVGNHTNNHLNGWETENLQYFHNVRHCAREMETPLFRPPYGKLKPKQAQFLQRHYQIVMWDVLSGDFDQTISKKQCYKNIIKNVEPGSIIVLHDSLKAQDRMEYALRKTLDELSSQGYTFSNLDRLSKTNQIRRTA